MLNLLTSCSLFDWLICNSKSFPLLLIYKGISVSLFFVMISRLFIFFICFCLILYLFVCFVSSKIIALVHWWLISRSSCECCSSLIFVFNLHGLNMVDMINIIGWSLMLLLFSYFLSLLFIQAGHVTKSGDIAGPRVLEHIVDAVLYMEVCTLI